MDQIVLVLITFIAATVNGALGYGFSSITVPVALLFYTNRILNPALVLVELVINSYVLFINRRSIPNIWWRVAPILIGLVVGVGDRQLYPVSCASCLGQIRNLLLLAAADPAPSGRYQKTHTGREDHCHPFWDCYR